MEIKIEVPEDVVKEVIHEFINEEHMKEVLHIGCLTTFIEYFHKYESFKLWIKKEKLETRLNNTIVDYENYQKEQK